MCILWIFKRIENSCSGNLNYWKNKNQLTKKQCKMFCIRKIDVRKYNNKGKEMKRIIFAIVVSFYAINIFADIIGEGLYGEDLRNFLIENYKTSQTLGYDNARDILYSEIDLQEGNLLEGVYSGFTIELDLENDPSTDAYNKGINCEHTWPQSFGAGEEPQKSDMHHLFPCKSNVNSSRGNSPFAELIDTETSKWYFESEQSNTIPTENIDSWAEKKNGGSGYFEPRESKKGDIARAVFYFYTMYNDAADNNFFQEQKDILILWNSYDPVSEEELLRTNAIAEYQDYPNPFVLDQTLAQRIWFEDYSIQNRTITDLDEINFIDDNSMNEVTFNVTNCYSDELIIEDITVGNPQYFDIEIENLPFALDRLSSAEITVIPNARVIVSDTLRICTNYNEIKIPINLETDHFVSADDNSIDNFSTNVWPNPINLNRGENVNISYSLKDADIEKLEIFNVKGEKIKTINIFHDNYATWNGIDSNGKKVASGIYFYRLESQNIIQTNKFIILK